LVELESEVALEAEEAANWSKNREPFLLTSLTSAPPRSVLRWVRPLHEANRFCRSTVHATSGSCRMRGAPGPEPR
jgi:hypothetical protein